MELNRIQSGFFCVKGGLWHYSSLCFDTLWGKQ